MERILRIFVCFCLSCLAVMPESFSHITKIEDVTAQFPAEKVFKRGTSGLWDVVLAESGLYFRSLSNPNLPFNRVLSQNELPALNVFTRRVISSGGRESYSFSNFTLGAKSLYFTSLCPIQAEAYRPCISWKFNNYQRVEQILSRGNIITAKIRVPFERTVQAEVLRVSTAYPNLEETRTFFILELKEKTTGLWIQGVFEAVGGVYNSLYESYDTRITAVEQKGVWIGKNETIVFLVQDGKRGLGVWDVFRVNLKTGQAETILGNGMQLFGETVSCCSLEPDLDLETGRLYIQYGNSWLAGNRVVLLTETGFEQIIGRNSNLPTGSLKFKSGGSIRLALIQESMVLSLGYVSESEKEFTPLIQRGDLVMGRVVEKISPMLAVHGCIGEFATLGLNSPIWNLDKWYRFSFACIQQAPASAKSGEEVVLKGQNLSVSASLVDVVATDNTGKETVITPTRIGPTEVAFLAPLIAEAKAFKVKVRQNQSGGPVVSNAVSIQVNPLPVPPPEISGIANGASFDQNQPLAPGTIFSLFGKNLGTAESARAWPLPRKLGGAKVTVCGVDAPLFVNTGPMSRTEGGGQLWQINGVVPNAVAGQSSCEVVVAVDQKPPMAVLVAKSTVKLISEAEKTLAIFTFTGFWPNGAQTQEPIITNQTGQLVAPPGVSIPGADPSLFTQARACEVVTLWATGGGRTILPVPDGEPAPSEPLARLETVPVMPVIQIYGIDTEVLFAGRAPGFAGLDQINVRVPCEATPGEQWLWFGRLPNPGKIYKIWVQ